MAPTSTKNEDEEMVRIDALKKSMDLNGQAFTQAWTMLQNAVNVYHNALMSAKTRMEPADMKSKMLNLLTKNDEAEKKILDLASRVQQSETIIDRQNSVISQSEGHILDLEKRLLSREAEIVRLRVEVHRLLKLSVEKSGAQNSEKTVHFQAEDPSPIHVQISEDFVAPQVQQSVSVGSISQSPNTLNVFNLASTDPNATVQPTYIVRNVHNNSNAEQYLALRPVSSQYDVATFTPATRSSDSFAPLTISQPQTSSNTPPSPTAAKKRKGPISGYILFTKEFWNRDQWPPHLKDAAFSERAKHVASNWRSLSKEAKSKYYGEEGAEKVRLLGLSQDKELNPNTSECLPAQSSVLVDPNDVEETMIISDCPFEALKSGDVKEVHTSPTEASVSAKEARTQYKTAETSSTNYDTDSSTISYYSSALSPSKVPEPAVPADNMEVVIKMNQELIKQESSPKVPVVDLTADDEPT